MKSHWMIFTVGAVVLALSGTVLVIALPKAEAPTDMLNPSVAPPKNPQDNTPTKPVATGKCYVGGCSGQVCSEDEGVVTTCEYRQEYACYKDAKCERQSDGKCGWTPSSALSACLSIN